MKSTIRKSTYAAIYRLLDRVSPLQGDCGVLCGRACCDCDNLPDIDKDAEYGIYLLPGEDKLFTRQEDWLTWNIDSAEKYGFPPSWHGQVYFVQCKTPPICVRKMRPLQCRTFPLTPHITARGHFHLIWNTDKLPYACPLVTTRTPLEESFIQATYTVWKRLLTDPLIYDLVKMDALYRGDDVVVVR